MAPQTQRPRGRRMTTMSQQSTQECVGRAGLRKGVSAGERSDLCVRADTHAKEKLVETGDFLTRCVPGCGE
eukprot:1580694-Rhodomonas_salina.5